MTVLDRIKEVARQRGMSLSTLAEKASLSRNAIYKWNRQAPQADKLANVANVLDVSVDYLLGNTETKTSKSQEVDLDDDNVIMTFEGKPIPPEDLELMKRLLRGKKE